MNLVDTGMQFYPTLDSGKASESIDRLFRGLSRVGSIYTRTAENEKSQISRSPLEERLLAIQSRISRVSMHLPRGFAVGINRQFSNLLDRDAWEDGDLLPDLKAVDAFISLILKSGTKRRPGIGTNGRGSITTSWVRDSNRLIIECLPSGELSVLLTRVNAQGHKERAALGPVLPNRISQILAPYAPGVWFDE